MERGSLPGPSGVCAEGAVSSKTQALRQLCLLNTVSEALSHQSVCGKELLAPCLQHWTCMFLRSTSHGFRSEMGTAGGQNSLLPEPTGSRTHCILGGKVGNFASCGITLCGRAGRALRAGAWRLVSGLAGALAMSLCSSLLSLTELTVPPSVVVSLSLRLCL